MMTYWLGFFDSRLFMVRTSDGILTLTLSLTGAGGGALAPSRTVAQSSEVENFLKK
jgi:hypothetical protein